MFIADLLVAALSTLIIVWIVSIAFGTKGPWGSLLWLFMVVCLFAWACGIWIMPFGPHWLGIPWFPIIFMGFLIAMLLVASSPRTSRKRLGLKEQEFVDANAAIDVFVWILMVCLLIFGIAHYVLDIKLH
jgi:hypothetical protein